MAAIVNASSSLEQSIPLQGEATGKKNGSRIKDQTKTVRSENAAKGKAIANKILRVACLISVIALTLFGAASLVGLGMLSAGIAFPLASVLGLVVAKISILPAWIAAAAITISGLAFTTLCLIRKEETVAPNAQNAPSVQNAPLSAPQHTKSSHIDAEKGSPLVESTKKNPAALKATEDLAAAQQKLEKATTNVEDQKEVVNLARKEKNGISLEITNINSQIETNNKEKTAARAEQSKAKKGSGDQLLKFNAAMARFSIAESRGVELEKTKKQKETELETAKEKLSKAEAELIRLEQVVVTETEEVASAQKLVVAHLEQ